MAALWIAFALNLDHPAWAMASAYLTAQPLAGMMRSKAIYRFVGTLIGATMIVVLIPNMSNAPALLVAALAGWIGVCLYFGLLDRTPRSYVFLLAGWRGHHSDLSPYGKRSYRSGATAADPRRIPLCQS
jgi:uncharacterized membrane protein YccC